MVSFTESSTRGQQMLSISDGQDVSTMTLHLPVFNPVIGTSSSCQPTTTGPNHPTRWFIDSTTDLFDPANATTISSSRALLLRSSLHSEENTSEHFTLLGDQIDAKKAVWKASLSDFGQSTFIERYWEWLEDVLGRYSEILFSARIYGAVYASLFTYDRDEDLIRSFCELWCPSTNTLHTPDGELSISLCDLYYIGGLPIYGKFYDEVIPSAHDLTRGSENNKALLPSSCKYLFSAYYRLVRDSESHQVTASNWVKFWCRLESRYVEAPTKDQRKRVNSPTGQISKPLPRTKEEEGAFDDLGVKSNRRDETYLAAFLSCWLSIFVLPNEEVGQIRPSVFKVASMMACGDKFSLAVPVLASIYRGLKCISSSTTPNQCGAIFPIHYVYGWLGNYFEAYFPSQCSYPGVRMSRLAGKKMAKHFTILEARNLLRSIKPSELSSLSLFQRDELVVEDNGVQTQAWTDYIINLRSSYLTLRRNDEYTVELYNPHRFSRQFNFCQDIPGNMAKEACPTNLEDVVQLWKSCMKLGTNAKFKIPIRSYKPLVTKRYMEWWMTYSSNFVKSNSEPIAQQVKSNPQAKFRIKKAKIAASSPSKPKAVTRDVGGSTAKASKAKGATLPSATTHGVGNNSAKVGKANQNKPSRAKPNREKGASKVSSKGAIKESVEPPITKISLKIPTPKLASTSVKNSVNMKERNKRSLISCDGDSSSSNDYHWNRLKKKTKVSDLENIDLDVEDVIKNLPLADMPLEDFGEQLEFNTADLEGNLYSSGASIDGPDSFGLLIGGPSNDNTSHRVVHEEVRNSPTMAMKESRQPLVTPSSPAPSVVSMFRGEEFISSCQRDYVMMLWSKLSSKIGKSCLDHINAIEDEASMILEEMSKMNKIDTSLLRDRLESFFKNVQAYNSTRSSSIDKVCEEKQARQLVEASRRLSSEEIKEGKTVNEIQLHQENLASLEVKEAQLKKDREKIEALILEKEEELSKLQVNISNFKDEVSTIKKAQVQSDSDLECLQKMKKTLEESQKELIGFKLFP